MVDENKFLFTLVFDGDYSIPGTIKHRGNKFSLRNDAGENAKAIRDNGPASVGRLEQLTFYQDPAPDPTRVVLTGVAGFTDLIDIVDDVPKLLDENGVPVSVDGNGFPTRAKVIGDFFRPLIKVIVDDHRDAKYTQKSLGSLNNNVPIPKFTWVVVPLLPIYTTGILHSEGMEGISGDE